jgi:hypothetical protein
MDSPNETCPLCGSVIPRTKFVEITRIREQEQKKLADTEAEIRRMLEQKFLRDLEAAKQAAEKRLNEEAEKRVAAIAAERDRGLQKVKQLEDQEASLRKQTEEDAQKRKALEEKHQQDLKIRTEAAAKRAAEEAEKRLTIVAAERDRNLQKVKQLEDREAALRKQTEEDAQKRKALEEKHQRDLKTQTEAAAKRAAEEAEKRLTMVAAERDRNLQKVKQLEDREAALRKQTEEDAQKRKALEEKHRRDLKTQTEAAAKRAAEEAEKRLTIVAAERDRTLQKVKQLEEREAAIRKEATEEAQRSAQKELDQERLILKQAQDTALLKKEGEFGRERESWQKKIQDMQRQLEQKTANQLGDGAELDLLETLREAFRDDRITPVPKGRAGADIHHYVMHKGETCGLIIYDSKNHQDWRDHFATKLRDDRIEAKAEYAILSTAAFPKGKKGLCVESDVIVVSPAQAVHVAGLLRQALVTMHVRGLSQKERAGKTNKLYQYITSGEYAQRFSHVSALTEELLGVDVKEQGDHGRVWKKRGELLIKQRDALREIDTEIAAIVESDTDSKPLAASPSDTMEKSLFSRN